MDTIPKTYMKEEQGFRGMPSIITVQWAADDSTGKLREIDTTEMAILQGGDQKHQDSETVQKYKGYIEEKP